MTTFNFRAAKDTHDIAGQSENVIEATTGTRPKLTGSQLRMADEVDGDAIMVAVDFMPDNNAVRGGTVGVSRGAMRGAR